MDDDIVGPDGEGRRGVGPDRAEPLDLTGEPAHGHLLTTRPDLEGAAVRAEPGGPAADGAGEDADDGAHRVAGGRRVREVPVRPERRGEGGPVGALDQAPVGPADREEGGGRGHDEQGQPGRRAAGDERVGDVGVDRAQPQGEPGEPVAGEPGGVGPGLGEGAGEGQTGGEEQLAAVEIGRGVDQLADVDGRDRCVERGLADGGQVAGQGRDELGEGGHGGSSSGRPVASDPDGRSIHSLSDLGRIIH